MFLACFSLIKAQDTLLGETLATCCYYGMFQACTLMEVTPFLPARKLVFKCYAQMFESCKKLKRIDVAFNDWDEETKATHNWVAGINTTHNDSVKFICSCGLEVGKYDYHHIPMYWKDSANACVLPKHTMRRRQDNMIHEEEEKELIIEDIENNESKVPDRTRKVLENGQIIVIRDNVKYDLKGQIIK